MNRQQFIAELSQYLTFFSPEEKAEVISAYNEKFDSAGPECEAAVIAELGTPMMTAIDLKRRMEAGEKLNIGDKPASCEEREEADSESVPEAAAEETPEEETAEAAAETGGEAEEEKGPELSDFWKSQPKAKPGGAKFTFAIIGAVIVSVVVAAVFLAVGAAGAGFFVAMWYLIITGLKSLVYIMDALLLFGGGLICAGLGLIVMWFALWSAISIISGLFRGACKAGTSAADKE